MVSIIGYGIIFVIVFFWGVRIVRPTENGVVERLGKYNKTAKMGFHWIIPVIDKMSKINVTEIRVDIPPQEVITRDKLNAHVDAVVYYRVRNGKKALYNVNNFHSSVVSLARTTLRAVIGKMNLSDANEKRDHINHYVETEMTNQIEKPNNEKEGWGIDILRVEIQEITPPNDVQAAMNNVVKAENEKIAAIDLATATETKADGERRAEIKKAEGVRQGNILKAEGEAQAIKLVNEAANKYFKGNAQILKKLETAEISLRHNAKIVVPAKTELVNVIGDLAGVLPVKKSK
ncbi:SPFH/Band 7/PHB domain protein [archaeon]|jgi:regulator of protease activity HflC (stomatin/prohibitin superfamily)|nr:SPFH/Band 7/PHB domain protein [archaeon]MBT4351935.1 SPFH/Band 7/PHB domain protein [archaeon]MBT4647701.1 SPFH/Band 7/PHB domain protein [archaeon]MBT6822373.1 SPFH/Band 7/PHB domain protein [archaeon]MBT7391314.1 SPFH/Band 7/PHB domain protein [archaeon]